jgi:hypothetical protein
MVPTSADPTIGFRYKAATVVFVALWRVIALLVRWRFF